MVNYPVWELHKNILLMEMTVKRMIYVFYYTVQISPTGEPPKLEYRRGSGKRTF